MADKLRSAEAVWKGNLQEGEGKLTAKSGIFKDVDYSFATRFEDEPGTNPEELIAAAHAGCFNMAFANILSQHGFEPKELKTTAKVTLKKISNGFKIARVHLECTGDVDTIDEVTFRDAADSAKEHCPVSVLLKPGLEELTVEARLKK